MHQSIPAAPMLPPGIFALNDKFPGAGTLEFATALSNNSDKISDV